MNSTTAQGVIVLGLVLLIAPVPVLAQDGVHSMSERAALTTGTVGFSSYPSSPRAVMVPASYDVSIEGDLSLGGFVFKDGYAFIHNEGGAMFSNTAIGLGALESVDPGGATIFSGQLNTAAGFLAMRNTTDGDRNTALGSNSLYSNTTGFYNTGIGVGALEDNYDGNSNTALGALALPNNTSGGDNIAIGYRSMNANMTGSNNIAIGNKALDLSVSGDQNVAIGTDTLTAATGSRNIALGHGTGSTLTDGTDNILIGSSNASGGDTHTVRIGNGTGTGDWQQDKAFISGIRGAIGVFDEPVCTKSTDQLGPCAPSSRRFKEDVRAMGDASISVQDLRPVTFRYTEEFGGDSQRPVQYGLIAEEVAEIFPGLVSRDADGRPRTVRYDALAPLLLHELQKQHAVIEELRARLEELERQ